MFFERWNKLVLLFSALSATAIFTTVVANLGKPYELSFSFFLALITFTDLVINSARMSRLHSDLYMQFVNLEKDLVLAGDAPEDSVLRQMHARRLSLEAEEPPVLTILNLLCHNEIVSTYGYDKSHLVSITAWQRFWAHLYSFGEQDALSGSRGSE